MKSDYTNLTFHYPATLDPWLRHSHKSADRLLKLIALTSSHVVLSDNQVINNPGLQRLFRREDVRRFLETINPITNKLPFVIALREGARDFDDVLFQLVVDREIPAIIPWMNSDQQTKIEKAYSDGKSKTLGPFYDIAGNDFIEHIGFLNSLFKYRYSGMVSWKGLKERYPTLVGNSIGSFLNGVNDSRLDPAQQYNLKKICEELLLSLEDSHKANRSNLYRIIQRASIDTSMKARLTLKLLTQPYHNNIAEVCSFHQVTGPEYMHSPFPGLFSSIAKQLRTLNPIETYEIDQFPIQIEQISYSRITKIRQGATFHNILQKTYDPSEPRPGYLRDFLNLLKAEIAKEPGGLKKLGRLRVHLIITPKNFVTICLKQVLPWLIY